MPITRDRFDKILPGLQPARRKAKRTPEEELLGIKRPTYGPFIEYDTDDRLTSDRPFLYENIVDLVDIALKYLQGYHRLL